MTGWHRPHYRPNRPPKRELRSESIGSPEVDFSRTRRVVAVPALVAGAVPPASVALDGAEVGATGVEVSVGAAVTSGLAVSLGLTEAVALTLGEGFTVGRTVGTGTGVATGAGTGVTTGAGTGVTTGAGTGVTTGAGTGVGAAVPHGTENRTE
jgi:hypothetical protein